MGYLICEKCGRYFKLEPGESIDDFEGCECSGKLRFIENLYNYNVIKSENEIEKTSTDKNIVNDSKHVDEKPFNWLKCPECGAENNKDAIFCKICGYKFNSSSKLIRSTKSSLKPSPLNKKKTDGNVCSKCGEKNVNDAKFCAVCGTELKKNDTKSNNIFEQLTDWFVKLQPADKILVSFGLVALIVLISVVAILNSFNPSNSPYTTEFTTESDISYIQSCKSNSISLKKLTKNPGKYIGSRVCFKGNVFQIMEKGDVTDIILGSYLPNLYVFYGGTTPILEDDNIYVFGEAYGSYTYTSRANYKINLPVIKAKYIAVRNGNTVTIYPSGTILSFNEFKNL